MDRFPLLNTYRGLLIIAAVLIIIVGFFGGLSAASETNTWTDETEFTVGTFLLFFGIAAGAGITLLVMAELIHLGLAIEDHLYHMRRNIEPARPASSSAPSRAGSRSYSSTSSSSSLTGSTSRAESSDPQQVYSQALAAYRNRDYPKAVELFEQALLTGAGMAPPPALYFYRAQCYREMGETEKYQADMKTYNALAEGTSNQDGALFGTVAAERTMLRQEPREGAELFTMVMQSTRLKLIGRNNDSTWVKVEHREGDFWVDAADLTIDGDVSSLPLA
ncbi:MAG: hypothetical protein JW910_11395 [Anaerolineae bacterium]|nr:hypothetical protein [Anaerolineae bacterium]